MEDGDQVINTLAEINYAVGNIHDMDSCHGNYVSVKACLGELELILALPH